MAEAELPTVEAEWAPDRETRRQPGPADLWTEVHVVGESYRNPDGTSRQELIRTRAHVGDALQLLPEPNNEHDPNAVRVCLATGEQLGYLASDRAEDVAEERRNGRHHAAIIHRVIGGTPDKPSVGVLLRLVSATPGTTEAEMTAALESARGAPSAWEREQARRLKPGPLPPPREPRVGNVAVQLGHGSIPELRDGPDLHRPRVGEDVLLG